MKKTVIIIVISIVTLISLTEISLRFVKYEELKIRKRPMIYNYDSLTGYEYQKGACGLFIYPGFKKTICINNNGFIGPEFDSVKKEGYFRIAIVGFSDASGLHNDVIEAYPEILERIFKEKGYSKIEVINCSRDGNFKGMPIINKIRNKVMSYNPDLIIIPSQYGILPLFTRSYGRINYNGYVIQFLRDDHMDERIAIGKERIDYLESKKAFLFIYRISYIYRLYCKMYFVDKKTENINIIDSDYVRYYVKRTCFVQHNMHLEIPYIEKGRIEAEYMNFTQAMLLHDTNMSNDESLKLKKGKSIITTIFNDKSGEYTCKMKYLEWRGSKSGYALHINNNEIDSWKTEIPAGEVNKNLINNPKNFVTKNKIISNLQLNKGDTIVITLKNYNNNSLCGLDYIDIFQNESDTVTQKGQYFISNMDILNKEYDLAYSLEVFDSLNAHLKKSNSRLVLFNYNKIRYKNEIEKLGIKALSLCIERNTEFTGGKFDGHSNQLGHNIIAKKLFLTLIEEDLIPEVHLKEN